MPNPFQELIGSLQKDPIFQEWKVNHTKSYPSHFFCLITADFQAKASWEIGFFDPNSGKITVFIPLPKNHFEIKPEDEVFKEENSKVEELTIATIKIPFEEAQVLCTKNIQLHYADEIINDGFVTLQTFNKETLWNFTFITQKIKFVNIKINATNGNLESHQSINLVQQ